MRFLIIKALILNEGGEGKLFGSDVLAEEGAGVSLELQGFVAASPLFPPPFRPAQHQSRLPALVPQPILQKDEVRRPLPRALLRPGQTSHRQVQLALKDATLKLRLFQNSPENSHRLAKQLSQGSHDKGSNKLDALGKSEFRCQFHTIVISEPLGWGVAEAGGEQQEAGRIRLHLLFLRPLQGHRYLIRHRG